MHVLAVGKWLSSAGRTVMEGMGWKPSSDAGRAGLDVQKYTCTNQHTSHVTLTHTQYTTQNGTHIMHICQTCLELRIEDIHWPGG